MNMCGTQGFKKMVTNSWQVYSSNPLIPKLSMCTEDMSVQSKSHCHKLKSDIEDCRRKLQNTWLNSSSEEHIRIFELRKQVQRLLSRDEKASRNIQNALNLTYGPSCLGPKSWKYRPRKVINTPLEIILKESHKQSKSQFLMLYSLQVHNARWIHQMSMWEESIDYFVLVKGTLFPCICLLFVQKVYLLLLEMPRLEVLLQVPKFVA